MSGWVNPETLKGVGGGNETLTQTLKGVGGNLKKWVGIPKRSGWVGSSKTLKGVGG